MLTFLTLLAALISVMFVASVVSVITESRKEDEDFRVAMERNKAF
ncbi:MULTISPECIES: hypothetical protein [Rhizobium/Agrobacterium group]|nr:MULTISPECIES: hypothetical protein [Rhizobium/Agrobacterium group]